MRNKKQGCIWPILIIIIKKPKINSTFIPLSPTCISEAANLLKDSRLLLGWWLGAVALRCTWGCKIWTWGCKGSKIGKFKKQKSPKSTLLAENTRGLITTKQTKSRPVAPITPAGGISRIQNFPILPSLPPHMPVLHPKRTGGCWCSSAFFWKTLARAWTIPGCGLLSSPIRSKITASKASSLIWSVTRVLYPLILYSI